MAARPIHPPLPRLVRLAYFLGLGPLLIAGRGASAAPVLAQADRRPDRRPRVV